MSYPTQDSNNLPSTLLGCQNSPAKGARYCEVHAQIARKFLDDEGNTKTDSDADLLIVNVLNKKSTRQGQLFEVFHSIQTLYLTRG